MFLPGSEKRLFYQFQISIKELLLLVKPLKSFFRKCFQRLHAFKNIMTEQCDDLSLLQHQPGNFTVDPANHIHAAAEIFRTNHFLQ